ncbi:MAG: hypothetical protein COA79_25865 [Planctomycetota bacterium]|nr:MAG: hypothetical protein COA79_25865 [Planctomycetota bacterium]
MNISVNPVNLVMALFSKELNILKATIKELINIYGETEHQSPIYEFTNTDYYEKTMGKPLFKQLISFKKLLSPEESHQIKLQTIELEAKMKNLSSHLDRPVNIDPGLLEAGKFTLFSTKNCMHRIYLNQGIYSEVTLLYYNGQWNHHRFTYPDFKLLETKELLTVTRNSYLENLKQLETS